LVLIIEYYSLRFFLFAVLEKKLFQIIYRFVDLRLYFVCYLPPTSAIELLMFWATMMREFGLIVQNFLITE
jgi:hypothetical protein